METKEKIPFWDQVRNLSRPFWVANIMEMIERLAYYGVRVVIPVYIATADEVGGLHFTSATKGMIFMWWAIVQSLLPVFTGGFADRYGYKNQIRVAIILKMIGYMMMATQRELWPFFTGCMMLAAGTAVFKPPVQATFVRTLNEKNSGVGWGFFYMVVNVGGFFGPPVAHFLYGFSWPVVFYGCAVIVSLNFFWLLTYPEVNSGGTKDTNVVDIAWLTLRNIMKPRLGAFILIMSAFWAGFTQLFDMMPNFIVDWVDSSAIAGFFPEFMLKMTKNAAGATIVDMTRGPQLAQEWMINLNPFMIIFLVVPISWFVNTKMRRLTSIFLGMAISAGALCILPASYSWIAAILGIVAFSLGEMLASPKMSEYLGVIAPPDQKALYMGYSNIPFAIGWGYGAWYAGELYGKIGEKAVLAGRYLKEELHLTDLPGATEAIQALMKQGLNLADATEQVWREKAFDVLTQQTGWSATEATQRLWGMYHPGQVWMPFVYLICVSTVLIVVYNWFARKWTDVNA